MNFEGVEFGKEQLEPLSQTRCHDPEQIEWVTLGTLDGFSFQRLDLLKIDAEGMENEILDGAADTIARCRPVMFVEFLKVDAEALRQRLAGMGVRGGGRRGLQLPLPSPWSSPTSSPRWHISLRLLAKRCDIKHLVGRDVDGSDTGPSHGEDDASAYQLIDEPQPRGPRDGCGGLRLYVGMRL